MSSKTRSNAIGPLLLVLGLGVGVLNVLESYAGFGRDEGQTLPVANLALWLSSWLGLTVVIPTLTLVPLVLPNGQLIAPGWRRVGVLAVMATVLVSASIAFQPGGLDQEGQTANPFAIDALGDFLQASLLLGYLLLIPAIGLSCASLIVRFRRSKGAERRQLKWIALAGLIAALLMSVSSALLFVDVWAFEVTLPLAVGLVPLGIGAAVLKERLYDIDRIINRTLVYALLSTTLIAVYLGLVLGLETVFRPLSGGSDLSIALTTLIVAALFMPARRRVQTLVNRRFNRRTYDAAQTLDAFAARLRQHTDLDTLRYELLAVVDETMEPARVSLWLRSNREPAS